MTLKQIKVTKIMLQIRGNESVLCSANQTCYHEKKLQPSFVVVVLLLFGFEEGREIPVALGPSASVVASISPDGWASAPNR